jgi:hypothetical protein
VRYNKRNPKKGIESLFLAFCFSQKANKSYNKRNPKKGIERASSGSRAYLCRLSGRVTTKEIPKRELRAWLPSHLCECQKIVTTKEIPKRELRVKHSVEVWVEVLSRVTTKEIPKRELRD